MISTVSHWIKRVFHYRKWRGLSICRRVIVSMWWFTWHWCEKLAGLNTGHRRSKCLPYEKVHKESTRNWGQTNTVNKPLAQLLLHNSQIYGFSQLFAIFIEAWWLKKINKDVVGGLQETRRIWKVWS